MSFCASCGRQRSGTSRFCGGCGAEFSDEAAAPDAQAAAGHDATLLAVDPKGTHVDPPGPRTDPFASWYQQATPLVSQEPETNWQPTQTVQSGPTGAAAGYLPPPYPPPAQYPSSAQYPPAAPPSFPPAAPPPMAPMAPPARGGGGRWLFITVAVIAVLAAGGGAYALTTTLGKHSSSQSPTQPTVAASTPAAGGSTPAAPASSAAQSSGSPTPSPSLSLVAISPGVAANTAEPQVETLLSHYFHGINTHSYAEYASTLNAAQLAKQSQSQFQSGYSSTTDSGMTLTGLTAGGSGDLTATVTFTSHQSPSQSVDNSACNAWTLNLYLVPQGTGYLIGPAPAGYQPTHSDC
jgi:hypothetical protein